jgi:hypothetical protein
MKNLPNHIVTVYLDSTGEVSKTRWVGTFTIKAVLSHADRFAKARMYAALIPEKEILVEEEDKLKAEVLSQLYARIVSGPEWWDGTRGGQLMIDFDPLIDLLKACQEESEKWSKRLEETASSGDANVVEPK